MNVTINGKGKELDQGAKVVAAIEAAGHIGGTFGIAIALNGEIVPRSEWSEATLTEGDRVEVLVAAQGG